MKFFWWRRPVPKFGKIDIAIIVDRKAARYLLIKDRRWDSGDGEWLYEGTAFLIRGGVLETFAQGNVYGETKLMRIRDL